MPSDRWQRHLSGRILKEPSNVGSSKDLYICLKTCLITPWQIATAHKCQCGESQVCVRHHSQCWDSFWTEKSLEGERLWGEKTYKTKMPIVAHSQLLCTVNFSTKFTKCNTFGSDQQGRDPHRVYLDLCTKTITLCWLLLWQTLKVWNHFSF